MDRLPDTTGMANEIIVQRAHRNAYDHTVRAAGARFVEVGYLGTPAQVVHTPGRSRPRSRSGPSARGDVSHWMTPLGMIGRQFVRCAVARAGDWRAAVSASGTLVVNLMTIRLEMS
jgi:hypothetical protein